MVGLQQVVEAKNELRHYVDEEGRGLRSTAQSGCKGAVALLDRSFLLYPVLLRPGAGGPTADFGQIHFETG